MTSQYDFVIIGAGSSGAVLAARLTEQPDVSVAILEAGGSDRIREIRMPSGFAKLFKTDYDWNYSTVQQKYMAGREMYWPRGKVLGGSSSLNVQMWVRGHRDDYDAWAADCPGWSYNNVLPYFQRAERRAGRPADSVYGSSGPLWISELRDPNPTTRAFLDACGEVGLKPLRELNGPDNSGYSLTPLNQRRGRRWSTADGYLRPAARRRNLSVITQAQARRIVFDGDRAAGVEYADGQGQIQVARARREVLLSAGALGSPQLLMLSGIGDPDHLNDVGIQVRHALPGVGADLQDHLAIGVYRHCLQPVTLDTAETFANRVRYTLLRRGPLTSNVGEAVAFISSDPDLPAPDLELIWAPTPYTRRGLIPPEGHGTTIDIILLQPYSRGRVTLASPNPAESPHIDPRYLTDERDLRRLAYGIRFAERVYATDAMRPFAGAPMEPFTGEVGDDVLRRYIPENAETLYHPVATCRMGMDDTAVVDPELRVRGINGLRVVDASVMPSLNRGHTHAPAVMIAERAADLIKGNGAEMERKGNGY